MSTITFWVGQLVALVAGLLSIGFARTKLQLMLTVLLVTGLSISSWEHIQV